MYVYRTEGVAATGGRTYQCALLTNGISSCAPHRPQPALPTASRTTDLDDSGGNVRPMVSESDLTGKEFYLQVTPDVAHQYIKPHSHGLLVEVREARQALSTGVLTGLPTRALETPEAPRVRFMHWLSSSPPDSSYPAPESQEAGLNGPLALSSSGQIGPCWAPRGIQNKARSG